MPNESVDALPEAVAMFTDATPLIMVEHDAIMQTLDRESNGVYLDKDFFDEAVCSDADKVPLIFAQTHPNPDAYDKDPEAELKRIGGRLIKGKATNTHIELTGHPRMMTTFNLHDKEIEDGIKEGKISTSNGMRARHDTKLLGPVRMHHILFFYEDGSITPGDKGAFILNTSTKARDEGLHLIDRLKALFSGAGDHEEIEQEEAEMTDTKELEGKLAIAQKEAEDAKKASLQFQADVAKKDDLIKAKEAEIEKLKTDNLTFLNAQKDAKWNAFKARNIPVGMVAKPEDEQALRAEFDADGLAFTEKILEARKKKPEAEEEGLEFTSGSEPKAGKVGQYRPEHKGTDKEWA